MEGEGEREGEGRNSKREYEGRKEGRLQWCMTKEVLHSRPFPHFDWPVEDEVGRRE